MNYLAASCCGIPKPGNRFFHERSLLVGHGINVIEREQPSDGLAHMVDSAMSDLWGSTVVVRHRVPHAVDTWIVMLCRIRHLRHPATRAQ